jgi:hypothetical protein
MPRNGSGVYSADWVNATPNTTIESSKQNALVADLVTDANAARPITAGGTGGNTAAAARTALAVPGLAVANTFTASQTWAEGAAIASASTLVLGTDGNMFHVTGVVAIGAISGSASPVTLVFDGILQLTHNATTLILPGAANIITAAGDTAIMVSEGSGNWRCIAYQRAAAIPDAWELIKTTTISSAADWKAVDLGNYRRLRISGYLLGASDGVAITMRTSSNNGSSYDGGASDYSYHRAYATGATPASDGSTGATGISVGITGSVGNDTGEGCHFTIEAFEFNRASYGRFIINTSTFNTSGDYVVGTTGALRVQATARNAIAIFFSSGNIASGFVALEGMRG